MKNNKGVMRSVGLVIGFTVMFIIIFFVAIFMHDIGRTEILDKIDDFANASETQLGVSEDMKTHIHSLPDEYSSTTIPYDLFFSLAFIFMYSTALYSAAKSREENMFKFFGMLYFGLIAVLFVLGVIGIIADWLIVNLIEGFVGFDLTTTPIINAYITNITIINFLLIGILFLVSKVNFVSKREEDDLINSEISRFRGGQ